MNFYEAMFQDLIAEQMEREKAMKAQAAREEAMLSPQERDLRRRFERAIFGKDAPEYLSAIWFNNPTELLCMAEAYRREGRRLVCEASMRKPAPTAQELRAIAEPWERASLTLVAVWMATGGHEQFVDHFKTSVRTAPIPPLPSQWWQSREDVYKAMGEPWGEPKRLFHLDEYRPH
ncbi:MAG: hypothetical protein JNL87_22990 [Burkholderiaceae bacterium]|nr:hypothetical protein [Burkholderiaceae bacterium]